ncbi:RNA polymerase sigma factor [Psychroserpens sp.]|jgi:RNA polymerase sigma factor (sigma-70 family)|uniref:RNA polymerase sigma factor n=1 Tax=Psychroserpens sp. TaxID=2020870 RepID=UPI0039E48CD1
MKELSDYELWESLKKGDLKAFSTLFKVFYPVLHNYGLKISNHNKQLTEDCLQDFFIYVYEHRKNLSSLNTIQPYLYSSFRRHLLKEMKRSLKIVDSNYNDDFFVDINFSSEDVMIQQEIEDFKHLNLPMLLNKLPNRQKEILYLKYYSNLNNEDISEVMGINYQSVSNLIYKGIKTLRQDASLSKLLKNIN